MTEVTVNEDNDMQRKCLHPNWQQIEETKTVKEYYRCFKCGATAPTIPVTPKTETTPEPEKK